MVKKYISKDIRAKSISDARRKASTKGYKHLGHIVLKRASAKSKGFYAIHLERKTKKQTK